MNFEEYSKIHSLTPLEKTEQSLTFTVVRERKKRIIKSYSNQVGRCKEELAYQYLISRDLLRVPLLTLSGEDFLEIEFIQDKGKPSLREIIFGISNMYVETHNDSDSQRYFPTVDLSKEKLFKRLEYIPAELEKRGFLDSDLIRKSEIFVERQYDQPPNRCVVHGDLKSPHIIKSERGLFFIDLGLVGIATPWYDLAFLYMERRNKKEVLENLSSIVYDSIGSKFELSKSEIVDYLKAAIFYRCLYNVGFSARHKSEKTLIRTLKELKEIMQE